MLQSQDIWGLIFMINFKNYFNGKKVFIPFITAGDPTLDKTEEFIDELIKAGSALIEIGIPFSDPIAEGKTIEEADIRALSAGCTTDKIFDMLKNVRKKHKTFPLVFMTYLNPVFNYGYEEFFKKCKELNMCGIIIPDLPFEEKEEVDIIAKKYDVALISLIAPTSKDRIKKIATEANGFVYLVSSLGVTGVRDKITTNVSEIALEIKNLLNKATDVNVCTEDDLNAIRSQRNVSFLNLDVEFDASLSSACYNVLFGNGLGNGNLYSKTREAFSYANDKGGYRSDKNKLIMSYYFFESYYEKGFAFLTGES